MVVDLDLSNIIHDPKAVSFAELPWRLNWRLFRSISKHMNLYKHCNPDKKILRPDNLPKNATNDCESSDMSVSVLGSKSVLSYKTVSDLYSGSEPEDAEMKNDDFNYDDPSEWVEPGIVNFEEDAESEHSHSQNSKTLKNSMFVPESPERQTDISPSKNSNSRFSIKKIDSPKEKRGCSKSPLKLKLLSHDSGTSIINEETPESSDGQLMINLFRVRRSFLSVFVSLLSGYRDFIRISSDKENIQVADTTDEEDMFDRRGFVRHVTDDSKKVISFIL
jgi:hypothetical protein